MGGTTNVHAYQKIASDLEAQLDPIDDSPEEKRSYKNEVLAVAAGACFALFTWAVFRSFDWSAANHSNDANPFADYDGDWY